MPLLLFVAFLAVPLIELWVILQVGEVIGGGWTLALLVADSVAGAYIVRREGRRAFHAFRTALADGRMPGDEIVQGALVLVGGALLLTPGFVTDVVGLLAVLPPSRALLSRMIRSRVTAERVVFGNRPGPAQGPADPSRRDQVGTPPPAGGRPTGRGSTARTSSDEVLEVEVVSIEPDEDDGREQGSTG